jgi:adenosylcobinamide-GDP ribazoletransferase
MAGNDISSEQFRPVPRDIHMALVLLTRLPLPHLDFATSETRPAAHAAWAYPLVGVVVGGISVVVLLAALALGLPSFAAALCTIAASVIVTGAMHEDGLADCADGFWGGWTTDRRLEIMKDSQIGTYGVLALLLSVGLRASLIAVIAEQNTALALISVAVLSRAVMIWMMYHLPNARKTGLSAQTGRPPLRAVLLALGLGAGAMTVSGAFAVPVILAAAVAWGLSKLSSAKIGGQTGDVLGATQQVSEIVLLASLVIVIQ